MIGAPIGSQYGGCLWTASGDMVCTSKAKLNYYGGGTEKTRASNNAKKETFVSNDDSSSSDSEDGDKEVPSNEDEDAIQETFVSSPARVNKKSSGMKKM